MARHRLWNVPIVIASASAGPMSAVTRSRSSRAALLVKVTASSRRGETATSRTRCAMRAVKTRVLPVPGPAATRTGPSVHTTAASCC